LPPTGQQTWRGRPLPEGLSVETAEKAEQLISEFEQPTSQMLAHELVVRLARLILKPSDQLPRRQSRRV